MFCVLRKILPMLDCYLDAWVSKMENLLCWVRWISERHNYLDIPFTFKNYHLIMWILGSFRTSGRNTGVILAAWTSLWAKVIYSLITDLWLMLLPSYRTDFQNVDSFLGQAWKEFVVVLWAVQNLTIWILFRVVYLQSREITGSGACCRIQSLGRLLDFCRDIAKQSVC